MKHIFAVLVLAVGMPCWGAVAKSVVKEAQRVESHPDLFIYGHGEAASEEEAVQNALGNIVRQISVNVQSKVSSNESETTGADGSAVTRSDFKATVDSWTPNLRLKGVKTLRLSDGSPYKVMCYLDRSAVDDMLYTRTRQVGDLCRDALRAADDTRIDDALKLLYRSYATLMTLPEPESVRQTVGGKERNLAVWIPQMMKELCHDVRLGIAGVSKNREGNTVLEVTASYKGASARSVAVTWFDGTGRSGVNTLRDGTGILELAQGTKTDPLTLDIEYRFVDDSYVAGDLRDVIAGFNGNGLLADAPKKVINPGSAKLKATKEDVKAFTTAIKAGADEGVKQVDKADANKRVMEAIVKAIAKRDIKGVENRFTERAYGQLQSLMKQGKATLIGKCGPGSYSFYPMGDRTVCRSVPMSFAFDNGRRVFREDVNFTFNPEGLVENIAFGLGNTAREDIIAKGGDAWNDYTKMVLITFLENYRTAFALKDLGFIETVFDDNAVIIVGGVKTVLKPATQGDMMGFKSEKVVSYARKSKKQYLDDLKRCFAGNAYVNLRFYGTDVEKMGVGGETFALQMKQDYTSQHYGDEGYLFLLVDFNNPDEPTIKIRTWQPDRMPELTPGLDEDDPLYGIFSSGYFG